MAISTDISDLRWLLNAEPAGAPALRGAQTGATIASSWQRGRQLGLEKDEQAIKKQLADEKAKEAAIRFTGYQDYQADVKAGMKPEEAIKKNGVAMFYGSQTFPNFITQQERLATTAAHNAETARIRSDANDDRDRNWKDRLELDKAREKSLSEYRDDLNEIRRDAAFEKQGRNPDGLKPGESKALIGSDGKPVEGWHQFWSGNTMHFLPSKSAREMTLRDFTAASSAVARMLKDSEKILDPVKKRVMLDLVTKTREKIDAASQRLGVPAPTMDNAEPSPPTVAPARKGVYNPTSDQFE